TQGVPRERHTARRLLELADIDVEKCRITRDEDQAAEALDLLRDFERLPVQGVGARSFTERMAGPGHVPDREQLEDAVAVAAGDFPGLRAAHRHAFPVGVTVLDEGGRRMNGLQILAPGLALRTTAFLQLAGKAAAHGERVEQDLTPDPRLGETRLGELTLEPEAHITGAQPLVAPRAAKPGGEECRLVVQAVRDLPGALEERHTLRHLTILGQVPAVQGSGVRPQALAADPLRDLHSTPRGGEALVGMQAPEGRGRDADVEE